MSFYKTCFSVTHVYLNNDLWIGYIRKMILTSEWETIIFGTKVKIVTVCSVLLSACDMWHKKSSCAKDGSLVCMLRLVIEILFHSIVMRSCMMTPILNFLRLKFRFLRRELNKRNMIWYHISIACISFVSKTAGWSRLFYVFWGSKN